jgi:hypothetical protein
VAAVVSFVVELVVVDGGGAVYAEKMEKIIHVCFFLN